MQKKFLTDLKPKCLSSKSVSKKNPYWSKTKFLKLQICKQKNLLTDLKQKKFEQQVGVPFWMSLTIFSITSAAGAQTTFWPQAASLCWAFFWCLWKEIRCIWLGAVTLNMPHLDLTPASWQIWQPSRNGPCLMSNHGKSNFQVSDNRCHFPSIGRMQPKKAEAAKAAKKAEAASVRSSLHR